MIYTLEKGIGLSDLDLEPARKELKKAFPSFYNEPRVPLRIKGIKTRELQIFVGTNPAMDAEGQRRKMPAPTTKASAEGKYKMADGKRVDVVFSASAPSMSAAGVPSFNADAIIINDGKMIEDEELALFLFSMSTAVKGGTRDAEVQFSRFEFHRINEEATNRIREREEKAILEREIIVKDTRFSYEKAKILMSNLGIASVGFEDRDRLAILDFAESNEKNRARYDREKLSIANSAPEKFAMSDIGEIVRSAVDKGVLNVSGKIAKLVKSDVESEEICSTESAKKNEKILEVIEYLETRPAEVDKIKLYLQSE